MSSKMTSSEDILLIAEKKSRLIAAVRQNDVDLLKVLLDSPKWYNTRNSHGEDLLRIAVFEERKEAFDYLLSIPDYPLEIKDAVDITSLEYLLVYSWRKEGEYYACELIKKGACIDKKNVLGDTLLNSACERGFVKASMLLIERGIDINESGVDGCTPLQNVCKYNFGSYTIELICMLLEFGADVSLSDEAGYTPFENSVHLNLPCEVKDALFYYTYDGYSIIEIHFDILLNLFVNNSPLYYEIIKHQFKIIIENTTTVNSCLRLLTSMDSTDLKILISSFEISFKILFAQLSEGIFYKYVGLLSIEKLNILIESNLKDQIINDFIPLVYLGFTYEIFTFHNESKLTEHLCFLLSHGIEMKENCLHSTYDKFKYSDLFKILLHMDIILVTYSCSSCILPKLLIYVTQDFEDFINKNIGILSFHQVKELMSYFVHPKLHSLYREFRENIFEERQKQSINIPQIPSLLELSRNVFRSYFIKKFEIKTARTFYTILNCLKISPVYKKIITYETKLYPI